MTNTVLNEFSVAPWRAQHLWGGGHTLDTDPRRYGWRIWRLRPGSPVLVVGRPGVVGCFSVIRMPRGRVDVALYTGFSPKDVRERLLDRDKSYTLDPRFIILEEYPGWGLTAIAHLSRQMELDRAV